MKNIKKIDYVPNIDCSCVQVSWKCFGTGIDVMGIIGILLLLGGIVQIGAGTYFMIVLPIFDSASNIWTGVITCIVGIVYMYYGFTSQTERKHYSNLSLALLALITNVANLVIIVVGERGIFLSEEDKLQIDRTSKNNLYNIAIWGTTSTSCTIILILFMVAQFIFCGYIQPGSSNKLQGRKKERFFPPSRIINSKHSSYLIPTLDEIMHPHNSPSSAWVYNGDDKLHGGFYPLGFESHPNSLESARRPPARHSSFAVTPRYEKVLQRPQRAKSFASNRDPFSLHGMSYSRNPNAHFPVISQIKRCSRNGIRRSMSMSSYNDVPATLSKKYQAFSNKHCEAAVIEVGSLVSEISDHNPTDNSQNPHKTTKITKSNEKSERSSNNGTYSKGSSNKGPAPQPPNTRPTPPKYTYSDNKQNALDNFTKKESSQDESTDTDQMSEEFCNCKSEDEELICNERWGKSEFIKSNINKDNPKENEEVIKKSLQDSDIPNNRSPIPTDNQISTERQKIASHEEFILALKSYLTNSKFSDNTSWEKLEQALVEILNQNVQQKIEPVKKTLSQRNIPRQILEYQAILPNMDTIDTNLDKVPSQDVQKNKIILRVPSFKTTSCQTEYYRPVRKKPLFAQTPWINNMDVQVNMTSSSSSGYSSPEAESKESSPAHSGPPSPSSTTPGGCESGPNVTIIEINRSDIRQPSLNYGIQNLSKDIFNQSLNAYIPPKPSRIKGISRHTLPTMHNNFEQMEPDFEIPNYTCSTLPNNFQKDNIMLLTEAINPTLVQRKESPKYAPRIIDFVPKNKSTARISRHDTFTDMGKQRTANVRRNSLSLPRVSYIHPNRPRLHRSESRSPSPPKHIAKLGFHPTLDKPHSTAAYLASLELLASHYRQQALANAKQLQMQRTMLEQRNYENKNPTIDVDQVAWLPQTINHE